jgi:putative ABC transport system permease protein
MLKNIFKHSFRALKKQKGYLLINIIGLSIGIACSLIIALFIMHELSYDQFNEKKDRIYRLVEEGKFGNQESKFAITNAPVGPAMLREFPEVEDFTRINTWTEPVMKYLDKSFIEKSYIEADSSFFNIFSIPLLRGDKKTVLNAPHQLVLSESTARKIFGKEDPMNKMLKIGEDEVLYRVAGIMADIPETSHFEANIIGSFITNNKNAENNWGFSNFSTYILLKPNAKPEQVNAKMPELIRKYRGAEITQFLGLTFEAFIAKYKYSSYLQPLKDIHLDPSISQNTKPSISPKYLFIFGSLAILIILIAAINYMNLSTAQASKRAKEVGIKKVSGSTRGLLIRQFLTESVILSTLSLALAIIIVENFLPYFNNLLGAKLQMHLFNNWIAIPVLLTLSVIVGVLSGSYTAFFLSSFSPSIVLKGKLKDSMKNGKLRSILVIFQFSISIVLIVGTIIMFRQIQFMLNKNLGFNKEQLLVIPNTNKVGSHVKAFKEALMKISGVIKVTSSTQVPGHSDSQQTFFMESRPGEICNFNINYVDYDYFDTYGIKILSGRAFNEFYATDKDACIVNERALKQYNLIDPFTTRLSYNKNKATIIGVSQNFHFESLQNEIKPYIFTLKKEDMNYGYISVRFSKKVKVNTIGQIEEVWKGFTSHEPLQFFFMDQDFAQKYMGEKQNAQLSVLFSIIAIIIASLGLFGLTSFTIAQRTKEIGIRKTMGASIENIFYLISKEFIILVSISTLIAFPLIFYVANKWLQNYYYRIHLRPFDFLAGFMIAIVIALLTISYRTIKSTRTNPVEALKCE